MSGDRKTNEDIFQLLSEIAKQNTEIKKEIKDLRSELSNEVEKLKQKNIEIKEENKKLKENLLSIERKVKKFNIIIYGIQEEEGQQIKEDTLNIINEKLKIKCNSNDIRDIHRIGKRKDGQIRPIVVEFLSYQLKLNILAKSRTEFKSLKECKIFFSQDYTSEDYEKNKFLRKQLKLAREKHYDARIKNGRLLINGDEYTYEQLKKTESERENLQDEFQASNAEVSNKGNSPIIQSEPTTPTVFTFPPSSRNVEERKQKLEDTPSKPTGAKPKMITRGTVQRSSSRSELTK